MKKTHAHRARPAIRLLSLPLVALLATCTDTTAPDRVIGGGLLLELVSGDDQRFIKGAPPPEPLVVRVVNIDGEPQSGVAVEWRVVEGGGAILVPPSERPPSQVPVWESTTDENGLTDAAWRMGHGPFEQSLRVSAGDRQLTVEVVAEPLAWTDVLDFHPMAEIVDGELRARIRIVNQWAGSVGFRPGCFIAAHLHGLDGQPVPGWISSSCTGVLSTRFLRAGEVLSSGPAGSAWRIDASQIEPGIYAIVFRFHGGLEVNGRDVTLPDMPVLAVVE
jgi:hypothetical protein